MSLVWKAFSHFLQPLAQSKIINFIFLENLPKELLTSYMEGLRAVRFRVSDWWLDHDSDKKRRTALKEVVCELKSNWASIFIFAC